MPPLMMTNYQEIEMTPQAQKYLAFAQRAFEQMETCKHGHPACSDRRGGKCSDEYYVNLSEQAREEVDES